MSPRGLVLLLALGLCAAQVASVSVPSPSSGGPTTDVALSSSSHARLRHERALKDLLAAAKTKLAAILEAAKDAAGTCIETVMTYVRQLEADALEAGTAKLQANGINVNLTSIAELLKTNIKSCATDEKITSKAKDIVFELATCVAGDIKSLKGLIKNMQSMWETAKTLPDTMTEVANQCSAHVDGDEEEGDALAEFTEDPEAHDLAEKANALLTEASKSLSKRDLWSIGRMARCVKAVYSLSKSDMITLPGQIVAAAANGYRIYQSAKEGNIQQCVAVKAPTLTPRIATLAIEMGTCVAQMDLDQVVAKYPALAGLRQMAAMAERVSSMAKNPPGSSMMGMGMVAGMLPGMGALPPAARQALAAAAQG